MGTDNGGKIPSDYFLYPEFLAFVFLPITWVLLPLAGFNPEYLGGFLPTMFLWTDIVIFERTPQTHLNVSYLQYKNIQINSCQKIFKLHAFF